MAICIYDLLISKERDRHTDRDIQNLTPSNTAYHMTMYEKKERKLLTI
jgi:hypothetical protein